MPPRERARAQPPQQRRRGRWLACSSHCPLTARNSSTQQPRGRNPWPLPLNDGVNRILAIPVTNHGQTTAAVRGGGSSGKQSTHRRRRRVPAKKAFGAGGGAKRPTSRGACGVVFFQRASGRQRTQTGGGVRVWPLGDGISSNQINIEKGRRPEGHGGKGKTQVKGEKARREGTICAVHGGCLALALLF